MAEKERIFSSSIKYRGIFSFKDFYKFCYDWLTEETGMDVAETKYEEKLSGDEKEVKVEWIGTDKVTDYFKFEAKVVFEIKNMKEVEIVQGGAKIKTNQGGVKTSVKGTLIRDYEGKFEKNAFQKFSRGIYEKWVIHSRVEQFEEKLIRDLDEFLAEAKSFLDLEGKK